MFGVMLVWGKCNIDRMRVRASHIRLNASVFRLGYCFESCCGLLRWCFARFLSLVVLFSLQFFLSSFLQTHLIAHLHAEEIVPQVPRDADEAIVSREYGGEAVDRDGERKAQANAQKSRLPLLEQFSGVDATTNQIGFYSGGVTGALGPHLNLPGFKLRAVYGRGLYAYTSSRKIGDTYVDVQFKGSSEFYEVMAGYEFRVGKTILKAYGGAVSETNRIDPNDPQNSLEGAELGAKLLLEGWYERENGHWISTYGSYSTGSEYYVVHGRYGVPVIADVPLIGALDVGIEAGVFGNKEFDAMRFGGFSRHKLGWGELTFSAGISGDYDQPDAFYGTMQYFTKINSFSIFK